MYHLIAIVLLCLPLLSLVTAFPPSFQAREALTDLYERDDYHHIYAREAVAESYPEPFDPLGVGEIFKDVGEGIGDAGEGIGAIEDGVAHIIEATKD